MALTEKEAKDHLRRRYERRGYSVQRIRKVGEHFSVNFGLDDRGVGLGPSGLETIFCNWPLSSQQQQKQFKFMKRVPPETRRRSTSRNTQT